MYVVSMPDAAADEVAATMHHLKERFSHPENAHRPLILRGDATLRYVGPRVGDRWGCDYCRRVNENPDLTCRGCGAPRSIRFEVESKKPDAWTEPVREMAYGPVAPRTPVSAPLENRKLAYWEDWPREHPRRDTFWRAMAWMVVISITLAMLILAIAWRSTF